MPCMTKLARKNRSYPLHIPAFMRGRKKRKQGEDNALVGWPMQHGSMLRALVHDTSIGGLMIRQGRASNQWLYFHWSPLLVAYCT